MGLHTSAVQRLVTIEMLRGAEERFWSRVATGKKDDCWEWMRGRSDHGYGKFNLPSALSPTGRPLGIGAHRVAWMLHHGRTIPARMVIDHRCGNPPCCNPHHLDVVPQAVNSIRGGTLGRGARTSKPRPYVAKDGKVTWRVRFREYHEDGTVRATSKTFPTEADALTFIEQRQWKLANEADYMKVA